jgi:hypothetical protein
LVTTGGGALPLPVCAQAARLRIARITAVPTAIFFIGGPHPGDWTVQIKKDVAAPLVQKSHSLQAIYGALYDDHLFLARNAQYRVVSRYL